MEWMSVMSCVLKMSPFKCVYQRPIIVNQVNVFSSLKSTNLELIWFTSLIGRNIALVWVTLVIKVKHTLV